MEQQIRTHLEAKQYREAFELLMAEYENKVFRLSWSILGNRGLAEETAQDVFLRIWRALPGFRQESSLSTWIFAITRNTALSARKASRPGATVSIEEHAMELEAPPARVPIAADVASMVAGLPEKYRQAVMLYHMEERSYEEVARMLDLPMGTVKTYLYRARKELAARVHSTMDKA